MRRLATNSFVSSVSHTRALSFFRDIGPPRREGAVYFRLVVKNLYGGAQGGKSVVCFEVSNASAVYVSM